MNHADLSRRTEVEIAFDGADITNSIKPYLLSVTYTDNEEGETDDLQVKVQDRDGEWLQSWLDRAIAAAAGAKLTFSAAFTQKNWGNDATLPTGDFELDGVSYDDPPATAAVKGTSLPFSAPIRQTKKSKAWENYALSGIAGEIAGANGMRLLFESANDPFYERVEQRKTSDSAFLAKLCKDAGISLKATDGALVLFDQAVYEAKPPVRTIRKGTKGGYTKVSLSTGAADHQYGSCRVSYVDPGSGKCIEGTYSANEEETGQCLEISAKVSDAGEAKALAEKRLRLHNRLTRFASFSFPGDPALVASVTVQLEGWGGWDGKYIIKRAVHTVDTSGYTTKINARRCLEGY
jgi:phage protein D